jgi:formylglycine-generating enzyme required for sulfatase activity
LGAWNAGDTRYFQAWYRDPVAGGATFNLSDGYEIVFQPDVGGGVYDGMALVPGGGFQMGRHVGGGGGDELPVHTVSLDAFYVDACEVTIARYATYLNNALARGEVVVGGDSVVYQAGGGVVALCDTNTSSSWSHLAWDGTAFGALAGWEEHPMNRVSWYGACAFANGRGRDEGLPPCYDELTWACDFTALGYRLPTEAEWEYAARGGEHTPSFMYPWGDGIDGSNANYQSSGDPNESGSPETTPVGYYDGNQVPPGVDMANGYGLYDVSGNVWEWCWDWYDGSYYSNSPTDNPTGPQTGTYRVFRGGSWSGGTSNLRSAERAYDVPPYRTSYVGFRVLAVRP